MILPFDSEQTLPLRPIDLNRPTIPASRLAKQYRKDHGILPEEQSKTLPIAIEK